uniref:Sugar transporter SWEET1 n=2 Tax=Panagrolaimus sp. PS1159 TaxID=55785 RepID=A0AC35GRI3_9BILA
MGLFEIFTAELMAFSVFFTFLPMVLIKQWKERGTAEGFTSVNFVLPMLMQACWFRHVNICNQYLIGQVTGLLVSLFFLFSYVDQEPEDTKRHELMSGVAATTQIFSLLGGVYEIKRAIDLKTTEYIPATIQFGIFLLVSQWTVFALLIGNYHMFLANLAGLAVNVATIALYFIYPPLNWTVPIFNIPPQKKKE